MRRLRNALVIPVLALAGCNGGGDLFAKSCNGKPVPNCRPFEYSVVQSASLEPEGVQVNDPEQRVDLRVELATCGEQAPTPHVVAVSARAEAPSGLDGGPGPSTTVFELLMLRDDGTTFGDAEPKDGVIDVTVDNPFVGGDLPDLADEDVVLRFEPRTPPVCDDAGLCIPCRGEAHEIRYHVGPRFMP